jgi:hypothetical protein
LPGIGQVVKVDVHGGGRLDRWPPLLVRESSSYWGGRIMSARDRMS